MFSQLSKAQGLLKLRWVAIVSMIVMTVPLYIMGGIHKDKFPFIIFLLSSLIIFNLLSPQFVLNRKSDGPLLVQLLIDLLAFGGWLFALGTANGPFVYLLCLHAFLGGLLLRRKNSIAFAVALIFVLILLQNELYQDAKITLYVDMKSLYLQLLAQWLVIAFSFLLSQMFARFLEAQEIQIRHLQESQHRRDRLKSLGALMSGFAHQIATPLNATSLHLSRAMRLQDFSEVEKALLTHQESSSVFQQMRTVFSSSDENQHSKVNLQQIIQELCTAWLKDHPSRKLQIAIADEEIFCDLHMLSFTQSFFDILDNANEASQDGAEIILQVYRDQLNVHVVVIDQGAGLSKNILSQLGQPFVTDKIDGNGLGVFSAMMMAQAHGGDFEIKNNSSGTGAQVRIRLPLEVVP
jgi:two-component system sensor histidine kinase RegB